MSKRRRAVIDVLKNKRIRFEILAHRPTMTAADEAACLHVAQSDVLKTVVLDTAKGHAVAVTPASARLDMALVRKAVADRDVHLAGEREMERDFAQFELGSLPPLPSLTKVPVFIDPAVMTHPTVIFALDHEESVLVKTADLFSGEDVTVTPLVRHVEAPFATAR